MMLNPLISVIIPVYNVEKYLKKCVSTIISQSFDSFELILINDGSTDNSGLICDDLKEQDSRIKVFHISNKGVSNARNLGIDKSVGSFLCFIDSDDWVEKDYLKNFFSSNNFSQDIYIQGYKRIKGGKFSGETNLPNYKFSNLEEFIIYCEKNSLLNSPCFKLFKRDILLEYLIKFDLNFSLGEDHIFSLEYLKHIKTFESSNKNGYRYRIATDGSSLTTKLIDLEAFIKYINKTANLRIELIKIHNLGPNILTQFDIETNKWILYLVHSLLDKRRDLNSDEIMSYLEILSGMIKNKLNVPGNSKKSRIYNFILIKVITNKSIRNKLKIKILSNIIKTL